MSEPMRIRARLEAGICQVTVLIEHEMETGMRRNAEGALIPAWYIRRVHAELNGKRVFDARWGTSISKNPVLRFSLRDANAGDQLAVSWEDNRGQTRKDQTLVT